MASLLALFSGSFLLSLGSSVCACGDSDETPFSTCPTFTPLKDIHTFKRDAPFCLKHAVARRKQYPGRRFALEAECCAGHRGGYAGASWGA